MIQDLATMIDSRAGKQPKPSQLGSFMRLLLKFSEKKIPFSMESLDVQHNENRHLCPTVGLACLRLKTTSRVPVLIYVINETNF